MTCGCTNGLKNTPSTENLLPVTSQNTVVDVGKCCCNPKTVCEKVCKRHFDLWINAEKFYLKKCGKYVKLVFSGVRGITAYQTYNEFNLKLNCDRQIIRIEPENYENTLKAFKKRTAYLEFQSCANKALGLSYYVGDASYNAETNELVLTKNIPDKLLLDWVLITDYKSFKGKNVCSSLDGPYSNTFF